MTALPTLSADFQFALRGRVKALLESSNPGEDCLRMRLTARPEGDDVAARVDFHVLCVLARHIGTSDPLSEANLMGICEKRAEFEKVLAQILE
jgi:hypothetical protein